MSTRGNSSEQQNALDQGIAEKDKLLVLLQCHVGRRNSLSSAAVAAALGYTEREIQALVDELRLSGIAICEEEGGYFIAGTADELKETCAVVRERARHYLELESKLRRVPLRDIAGEIIIQSDIRL